MGLGVLGGFHPNQERWCPLTSVSLNEEQEDELLDAYSTPCKVGITPNPRALPSNQPGKSGFFGDYSLAGLAETQQFHAGDAPAQAGAVVPKPLRALLPRQPLPKVGEG